MLCRKYARAHLYAIYYVSLNDDP